MRVATPGGVYACVCTSCASDGHSIVGRHQADRLIAAICIDVRAPGRSLRTPIFFYG